MSSPSKLNSSSILNHHSRSDLKLGPTQQESLATSLFSLQLMYSSHLHYMARTGKDRGADKAKYETVRVEDLLDLVKRFTVAVRPDPSIVWSVQSCSEWRLTQSLFRSEPTW